MGDTFTSNFRDCPISVPWWAAWNDVIGEASRYALWKNREVETEFCPLESQVERQLDPWFCTGDGSG